MIANDEDLNEEIIMLHGGGSPQDDSEENTNHGRPGNGS